ncbi:hypothetical protein MRX96_057857 [Rhipicephalus microplus]
MRFARRTAGLPKATAVAMHGARRTMADVSRSLPALAQPPATASPSHPAAPPAASYQATAADLDQQALKYSNALNAPDGGEWRGAPPATSHPATANPAYFYPTTLLSLGCGVKPASNGSQEYHDPANVETGSETDRRPAERDGGRDARRSAHHGRRLPVVACTGLATGNGVAISSSGPSRGVSPGRSS